MLPVDVNTATGRLQDVDEIRRIGAPMVVHERQCVRAGTTGSVGFEQQHDLTLSARHPIDRLERRRHQPKRPRPIVDAQLDIAAHAFRVGLPLGFRENTVGIAIDRGDDVPHDVDTGRQTKLHREPLALQPDRRGLEIFIEAVRQRRRRQGEHRGGEAEVACLHFERDAGPEFKATAARMSALNAFASISSPS